jgi:tetratricopeptide (TPR) repeat protein
MISDLKAGADHAFKGGDWEVALSLYSKCIEKCTTSAQLYNNRATTLCKLMKFEEAVNDASRAIEIDTKWVKPYLRKAKALQALRQFKEARETLETFNLEGADIVDKEFIRNSLRELELCKQTFETRL